METLTNDLIFWKTTALILILLWIAFIVYGVLFLAAIAGGNYSLPKEPDDLPNP